VAASKFGVVVGVNVFVAVNVFVGVFVGGTGVFVGVGDAGGGTWQVTVAPW
jgi:hypothetical protein